MNGVGLHCLTHINIYFWGSGGYNLAALLGTNIQCAGCGRLIPQGELRSQSRGGSGGGGGLLEVMISGILPVISVRTFSDADVCTGPTHSMGGVPRVPLGTSGSVSQNVGRNHA